MLDHRQVVGDEEIGEVKLVLQLLEQVDDLCLDRHVQRRDGLVAHDERRIHRQCARDADPLSLAARELVRVPSREVTRQPDKPE